MTNINVIDVQRALAQAAKSGLDLTRNPHTVILSGREYPTMFKHLDVNPNIDHWHAGANIPQENASIQKVTTAEWAHTQSSSPAMFGFALIPHLQHEDGDYKFSRFTDSGYMSSDTMKNHIRGRAFVQFDKSGQLSKTYHFLDKEGEYITDVHGWLKHHGSQPSTGLISRWTTSSRDVNSPREMRKMNSEELRLHKRMVLAPKGMVADLFWRNRTTPHGSIHVRLHNDAGEDLARYSYNTITESLSRLS